MEGTTDHYHLAINARARPFGNASGTGILRQNGGDRIGQAQHVAGVVTNAMGRLGREALAPDSRVERVAKLIFESQFGASRRCFAPEPSSANCMLVGSSFHSEIRQTAAPDQRFVRFAHDSEMAETARSSQEWLATTWLPLRASAAGLPDKDLVRLQAVLQAGEER